LQVLLGIDLLPSFSFSFCMSSATAALIVSPFPVIVVPISEAVPFGSLKYPATAFLIFSLEFISQSTMNRDIIAVTKSA